MYTMPPNIYFHKYITIVRYFFNDAGDALDCDVMLPDGDVSWDGWWWASSRVHTYTHTPPQPHSLDLDEKIVMKMLAGNEEDRIRVWIYKYFRVCEFNGKHDQFSYIHISNKHTNICGIK